MKKLLMLAIISMSFSSLLEARLPEARKSCQVGVGVNVDPQCTTKKGKKTSSMLFSNSRKKCFYEWSLYGKILNREKFNYEEDSIFAFKPSPNRFLCFFVEGSKIIITNAYKKQSQKMPPREKTRALKAKDDYIKRCKKGNYYD